MSNRRNSGADIAVAVVQTPRPAKIVYTQDQQDTARDMLRQIHIEACLMRGEKLSDAAQEYIQMGKYTPHASADKIITASLFMLGSWLKEAAGATYGEKVANLFGEKKILKEDARRLWGRTRWELRNAPKAMARQDADYGDDFASLKRLRAQRPTRDAEINKRKSKVDRLLARLEK